MDLNAALTWLNAIVINSTGHDLREPELVILRGTWCGLTYEQMAGGSDYSTNYLMRDVAPKLWKQLSNVFGRSVGKTNFRVAVEAYAAANNKQANRYNLSNSDTAADFLTDFMTREVPFSSVPSEGEAGIYWHPSVLANAVELADALPVRASNRGFHYEEEEGYETLYSGVSMQAVSAAVMVGYADELAQVVQWVSEPLADVTAHSAAGFATGHAVQPQPTGQLVGIWGLRGVGKTLLVEKLVAQVGGSFEGVAWRQLAGSPAVDELSASILSGLGVVPQASQVTAQLLALMAQKPLLIVLEGAEAILRAGVLAGDYQDAYQSYREFFRAAVGSRSCVVVTGLEGPADLVCQGGQGRESGRSLTLSRLSEAAAIKLLKTELHATAAFKGGEPDRWLAQWPELVARCQGHPLALKLALRVIQEIFNGQVDSFLEQSSLLFTDVLRLLAPSFERLSRTEVAVLYWLASQAAPLSLEALQQTLPLPLSPAKLVSVLYSLKRRSLLEINTDAHSPTFYPPSLVKAYAVHQFMNRLSYGEPWVDPFAYRSSTQVIDLSSSNASNVRLSQWFQGQFEPGWQSLERLFELSAHPAMRLRGAYCLQDETFIKRFKSTSLSLAETSAKAVLLVAIHRDAENLYKVCVQAQPAQDASVLPERLELRLLDPQQNVLATVTAQQDDAFIQLPYFRGAIDEPFAIELALEEYHHAEAFVI